jgi:phosphatidylglycerophosphate synthase
MYPTLRQIVDAHAWKRDYEKYLPISRFLFRPIGFLLTWVAIRVGLTTEAVSWLSGIVGIVGCLCLVGGYEYMLPVGIGLLLFFNLLDCVDGSIARTMKTENTYGKFLDSVLGDLVDFAFFFTISIMVFRHPNLLYWPSPFNQGAIFWLIIGGASAFFYIFLRHIEMLFEYQIYSVEVKISESSSGGDQADDKLNRLHNYVEKKGVDWKGILRLVDRNVRVRETIYTLLLIAVLLKIVDMLLLIYFVYFLLHTGISVIVYSLRAKKLRDVQLKF